MVIQQLEKVPSSGTFRLSAESGLSLLDHLVGEGSKKCTNLGGSAPLLLGIDRTAKKAVFIQANCKMWSCATCGARKARQWVARTILGIQHYGGQWFFTTLTAHRFRRGQKKSLHDLRQAWSRLYHRLKRKYGKFHYIKIFEHHKDKTLHLHLLLDLNMPTKITRRKSTKTGKWYDHHTCRVLKDMCAEVGIGFMADYQPIANEGLAAWYVTKYLVKSIGSTDFPKGLRRIQPNHNFPKLPDLKGDNDLTWVYITSRTQMLLKAWNLLKYEDILTYDAIEGRDITSDDFERVLE